MLVADARGGATTLAPHLGKIRELIRRQGRARWVISAIAASPVRYFGLGVPSMLKISIVAPPSRRPKGVDHSRESCSRSWLLPKVSTGWRGSSTLITCQPNTTDRRELVVPSCDGKGGLGKLRHHGLAAEVAQVAGIVLGRGSVEFSFASVAKSAPFWPLDDLQRFRLLGHQDVVGLGLLEGKAGLPLQASCADSFSTVTPLSIACLGTPSRSTSSRVAPAVP